MNKAELVRNLGDAQIALKLFDRAIELRERLVNQERRQEFADDLAAAYLNKAVMLPALGDNRSAVALCERATEILERLVNLEGRQELADALAMAYTNTAGVFVKIGDNRTAATFVDRALEIRERLAKQGGLQELVNLATVYVTKALTVNRLGDKRGALEINDRAIEIYERLVIREGQRGCRNDLATAYMHKAIGLCALGDNAGSLEFFDRAIELRERLVKQEGMRELSADLARSYIGKANVVSAIGNYRGAVEIYDNAIEIYQRLVHEGREELFGELATFKAYRATTLINLGERIKGLSEAHQAIANLRAAVARTDRADLQAVLSWLTEVLTEAGHPISAPDSEVHPMNQTDSSNNSLTVDEAAEALFVIMRQPFNKEWLSRLATVSGLDLTRAETELVFLDFFAIHFGLRITRSPGWQDNGTLVSEKLFSLVLKWWGDAWESNNRGTIDDAFRILDGRLKAYESVIEGLNSADPEGMTRALSVMYAMFALAEDSFFGTDGRPRKDRYPDHLTKLLLDHKNVVSTVGAEALHYRMHMLQSLFDSFTLK